MHGLREVGRDVSVAYRTYRPEYRHIPPGRKIFYELLRIKKLGKYEVKVTAPQSPAPPPETKSVSTPEEGSSQPTPVSVVPTEAAKHAGPPKDKAKKTKAAGPSQRGKAKAELDTKEEEEKKAKAASEKKDEELIKPYNIRMEKFVGSIRKTDRKIDDFLEHHLALIERVSKDLHDLVCQRWHHRESTEEHDYRKEEDEERKMKYEQHLQHHQQRQAKKAEKSSQSAQMRRSPSPTKPRSSSLPKVAEGVESGPSVVLSSPVRQSTGMVYEPRKIFPKPSGDPKPETVDYLYNVILKEIQDLIVAESASWVEHSRPPNPEHSPYTGPTPHATSGDRPGRRSDSLGGPRSRASSVSSKETKRWRLKNYNEPEWVSVAHKLSLLAKRVGLGLFCEGCPATYLLLFDFMEPGEVHELPWQYPRWVLHGTLQAYERPNLSLSLSFMHILRSYTYACLASAKRRIFEGMNMMASDGWSCAYSTS